MVKYNPHTRPQRRYSAEVDLQSAKCQGAPQCFTLTRKLKQCVGKGTYKSFKSPVLKPWRNLSPSVDWEAGGGGSGGGGGGSSSSSRGVLASELYKPLNKHMNNF